MGVLGLGFTSCSDISASNGSSASVAQDSMFMVTELCSGGTLREKILAQMIAGRKVGAAHHSEYRSAASRHEKHSANATQRQLLPICCSVHPLVLLNLIWQWVSAVRPPRSRTASMRQRRHAPNLTSCNVVECLPAAGGVHMEPGTAVVRTGRRWSGVPALPAAPHHPPRRQARQRAAVQR